MTCSALAQKKIVIIKKNNKDNHIYKINKQANKKQKQKRQRVTNSRDKNQEQDNYTNIKAKHKS